MWLGTTPLSSVVEAAATSKLPGWNYSNGNELDRDFLQFSAAGLYSSRFETIRCEYFVNISYF